MDAPPKLVLAHVRVQEDDPMSNPLQSLRDALQRTDEELRRESVCLHCGKPQAGIVQSGMTREEAGLCMGHGPVVMPREGDWADLHGESNDLLYADWPHDEERAAAEENDWDDEEDEEDFDL